MPAQVSVTYEDCVTFSNKIEHTFIDTVTTLFYSHQLLLLCFSVIFS